MKQKYILTLAEARSNKVHSLVFSGRGLLFTIFAALFVISLALYPLFRLTDAADTNFHLEKLNSENSILRRSMSDINSRIDNIKTNLQRLTSLNQQIQLLGTPITPKNEYGVGGPFSASILNLYSQGTGTETMTKLLCLESDVTWVEDNLKLLDNTLSQRIAEISHYPSIKPVHGGWISSGFGKRFDPFTGKQEDHPGLDISLPIGSDVHSTADGIVRAVNNTVILNKGYGKYIIIDHGYGYETLYAHLSKIQVKEGDRIKRWDIIGLSGNTGKSTAPHLHYGVYLKGEAQNPVSYILD